MSEPPAIPEPVSLLDRLRERTPARILAGRAGLSYRTSTALALREDHAFARDAVRAELDVARDLGAEFAARWGLLELTTLAGSKAEYLARPDLGRQLDAASRRLLEVEGTRGADVLIAVADGLSVAAVARQVPRLLPDLDAECRRRGWRVGRPLVVRRGRVGLLNEFGEFLDPAVAVLLIGERPGLATAESLSAYLAYKPRPADTDAHRELISNIHDRGIPPDQAAIEVADLVARMMTRGGSGVAGSDGRRSLEVDLGDLEP